MTGPRALLAALAALLIVPASASALTVSKAELRDGQLRIEGSNAAPGIRLLATTPTSDASARSDLNGNFKLSASGFRSDDCTAIVSDGRTPIAQPRLAGCTPVTPAPPGENPPPTGSCVIDAPAPATFHVGDLSTYFFTTTGCDTSVNRVEWTLVAGTIPPGMGAAITQGQTAGEISGRPTTEGTFVFTLRVTDSIGAGDSETFTVTIAPPRPLRITSTFPGATVGQGYAVFLTADGGLPGYAFSVPAGALPPGLRVVTGQIGGIPTRAGTFAFTLRVTDSRGAIADVPESITVAP